MMNDLDALEQVRAEGAAAERERCCRLVCKYCQRAYDGNASVTEAYYKNQGGWWVHRIVGKTSVRWVNCKATAIRASAEEATE